MINGPACWIKSGQQGTKTRTLIQWSHIISIGSPIVYTIAVHSQPADSHTFALVNSIFTLILKASKSL